MKEPSTMPSDIAVSIRNLSKAYTIAHDEEKHTTLAEAILGWAKNPLKKNPTETFWALNDVSFDIKKGDVVGIIGRNGAGKSTLLKILSRITEPTKGEIEIFGKVGSLLEVGTGFHPELTGRENVFLNGAILGMDKADIRKQFDAIVDFAGVEKFLDTPVKRYSSGMYVRLAFAVAAHLQSDILIVDEVLAVGDTEFQTKCLGKMGEVASGGRTVLFVSHNMASVEHLCKTAVFMRGGSVACRGPAKDVVTTYLEGGELAESMEERTDRFGSTSFRITSIELRSADGSALQTLASGQAIDIILHYRTPDPIRSVICSVNVTAARGQPVFMLHNRMTGQILDAAAPGGFFALRMDKLPLPPATYSLSYSVMLGGDYLDGLPDAMRFDVIDGKFYESGEVPPISHGVALVEGSWRSGEVSQARRE